jgi:Family of unknown function (DUF5996)
LRVLAGWRNGGRLLRLRPSRAPRVRQHAVEPATATFDDGLGEFVLPYADVRTAADPDELLLRFLASTHDAAATTGGWPAAFPAPTGA